MARRLIIAILLILTVVLGSVRAQCATGSAAPSANGRSSPSASVNGSNLLRPIITVAPAEADFGSLGPGGSAKAMLHLKSLVTGKQGGVIWAPENWTPAGSQNLPVDIGQDPEPFRMHLIYVKEVGQGKNRSCSLILRLEVAGLAAEFRREAPAGELMEAIRFTSAEGSQKIFFRARLVEQSSSAVLEIEPIRIDFGTVHPGESITRRVMLKNRGRESLKWRAGISGSRGMPPMAPTPVGRYVSFQSDSSVTVSHTLTGQIREGLELAGAWAEEGGYPAGQGEQNTLRYRFTGTGIRLYFWKSPDGGPFSVFVDDQFIDIIDGYAERKVRAEVLIAEGLSDGSHVLAIVNGAGKVTLEGVHLFGKPTQRGPHGWVTIFPDSGMTTRETDYINVVINTRRLSSGIYGEHLFFISNGGEADIPVFVDITTESQQKFLDVHRYTVGSDYLYTTNPQSEAARIQVKGYRPSGIVFRLFAAGTPGTTDFFRWFNPSKGDHYYSYDPKGGKALQGYIFEGSIGNIGTSRLTGTRELYRWFNPATNGHFYTTDQGGEGMAKKGYRFDGIAGFVR